MSRRAVERDGPSSPDPGLTRAATYSITPSASVPASLDSMRNRMNERALALFARQVNAVLAWCNTFLAKADLKAVDIENNFSDGIFLIKLIEVSGC